MLTHKGAECHESEKYFQSYVLRGQGEDVARWVEMKFRWEKV